MLYGEKYLCSSQCGKIIAFLIYVHEVLYYKLHEASLALCWKWVTWAREITDSENGQHGLSCSFYLHTYLEAQGNLWSVCYGY